MVDVDTLINRLENDGEEEIQKRLLDSIYDPKPQTKRIVEGWLLSKENERSEKRMNEHLAVSISAKHAAWVAAIAALIGAMFAIAAWIW